MRSRHVLALVVTVSLLLPPSAHASSLDRRQHNFLVGACAVALALGVTAGGLWLYFRPAPPAPPPPPEKGPSVGAVRRAEATIERWKSDETTKATVAVDKALLAKRLSMYAVVEEAKALHNTGVLAPIPKEKQR